MTSGNSRPSELDKKLHSEVLNLIHYIERLRKEIAGIAQHKDSQTRFEGMAGRLDAIITSTAEATDTILAAMEAIDASVETLRAHPAADQIDAACDRITEKTTEAMEACSFQDLTGQRVSRVVRSLRFVEERVNAMADICGRTAIETIGKTLDIEDDDVIDDGVTLEGPQRPGDTISQDDIDRLFA
ncbi:MAG: hypothetical protein ACE5GS_05190 [Kiloniellaceae bacterium]